MVYSVEVYNKDYCISKEVINIENVQEVLRNFFDGWNFNVNTENPKKLIGYSARCPLHIIVSKL